MRLDDNTVTSPYFKSPAYRYIRLADKLPRRSEESDPIAHVKLFDPTGSWTWYICEYDPETRLAWGLVKGFEAEVGYFNMDELAEARPALGLPLERDLHWAPRRLSELREGAL